MCFLNRAPIFNMIMMNQTPGLNFSSVEIWRFNLLSIANTFLLQIPISLNSLIIQKQICLQFNNNSSLLPHLLSSSSLPVPYPFLLLSSVSPSPTLCPLPYPSLTLFCSPPSHSSSFFMRQWLWAHEILKWNETKKIQRITISCILKIMVWDGMNLYQGWKVYYPCPC